MICLTRSYNAPTAWYGVDRPVAVGAGISPLLVAGRRQCCSGSRPLRVRRARRSDRVRCRAGDDAPSTRSPERGGGSSRARGRSAGPRRGRQLTVADAVPPFWRLCYRSDQDLRTLGTSLWYKGRYLVVNTPVPSVECALADICWAVPLPAGDAAAARWRRASWSQVGPERTLITPLHPHGLSCGPASPRGRRGRW